MKFWT
jgi:hypothetical protein